MSELEGYLLCLIVQKIEAYAANMDLEITDEELAEVVSLALQYTITSGLTKLHR